ncbi:MAG: glutamate--tRNA ligase [Microgenomates group bacterium]
MDKIRTRIAPSPTGFAHVGTAYSALFNFAFARNKKGQFIIRIEDTDVKRHVKEAEKAIYEGLSWLGIDWDEGPDKGGNFTPYRQSERLDIYQSKAKQLIKKGLAYEDEGAVRLKNPGRDVSWEDLVRGKINFLADQITDFVIIKSDGYPTYNFAVVVDDYLMKITHVIRGEEHISNTPRQLALYQAFKFSPPKFAHLPTLRNKDRKKLSKRRDLVDLRIYQKRGILPEALINYLCLLGWSHPKDKEIFDLEEFVQVFDIKRIRKAGPIFDLEKLDWMNGEYIRSLTDKEFAKRVLPFVPKGADKGRVAKIAPLIKERIKTLSEFESLAGFFFKKPKVDKKLLGKNYKEHLKAAIAVLENDKSLENVPKENDFKIGDFFMDLRIAITGKKVTPPINDSIVILGKEETLKRLKLLAK